MAQQPPKRLAQVREGMRRKHDALRTEQSYLAWIKRFSLFHHQRQPREMNSPEIEQFLTDLAVEKNVSPATQNQAPTALLLPIGRAGRPKSIGTS